MRRITAVVLSLAMSLFTTAPLLASTAQQGAQTGTVNGTAKGTQGQNLASYKVQIRNADTGQLASTTTTGPTGQFTFTGLSPANYVVEIVDPTGQIIGTSSALAVTAGANLTISVGATLGAAGSAIAAGGTAFWTSTAGILTIAAVGAGVAGVVVAVNKSNSSPSR